MRWHTFYSALKYSFLKPIDHFLEPEFTKSKEFLVETNPGVYILKSFTRENNNHDDILVTTFEKEMQTISS